MKRIDLTYQLFSIKGLQELFPSIFEDQNEKTKQKYVFRPPSMEEAEEKTKKRVFSPPRPHKRDYSNVFSSENTINFNDFQEISAINRTNIPCPLELERLIEQPVTEIDDKIIEIMLEDTEIIILWGAKPRLLGSFSTKIVFFKLF